MLPRYSLLHCHQENKLKIHTSSDPRANTKWLKHRPPPTHTHFVPTSSTFTVWQCQVSIRLHASSKCHDLTSSFTPFSERTAISSCKKASKDSVFALFQHAISSYYTTPSRSFLPRHGSQSWPRRSRMQYWAGKRVGGWNTKVCLHISHHMWGSLPLFQSLSSSSRTLYSRCNLACTP